MLRSVCLAVVVGALGFAGGARAQGALDAPVPTTASADGGVAVDQTGGSDAGLAASDTAAPPAKPQLKQSSAPAKPSAVAARFTVGFATEGGVFPGSILGAMVSLRLGGQRVSALLEAWTVFPTATAVSPAGTANTFSFGGTGGVCAELPVWSASLTGCALGRVGALLVEGRNATVSPAGLQPTAAAGLRVGLEWPRDSMLALVVNAHGFVPIVRGRFEAEGYRWEQPWFFGGGQVGLQLRSH